MLCRCCWHVAARARQQHHHILALQLPSPRSMHWHASHSGRLLAALSCILMVATGRCLAGPTHLSRHNGRAQMEVLLGPCRILLGVIVVLESVQPQGNLHLQAPGVLFESGLHTREMQVRHGALRLCRPTQAAFVAQCPGVSAGPQRQAAAQVGILPGREDSRIREHNEPGELCRAHTVEGRQGSPHVLYGPVLVIGSITSPQGVLQQVHLYSSSGASMGYEKHDAADPLAEIQLSCLSSAGRHTPGCFLQLPQDCCCIECRTPISACLLHCP